MNKVVLIGRLTRDPELRTTSGGVSNVRFSIAVNRNFKNKDGVVEADFFNIVAWRKLAENISKYCTKGTQVCVEGRLQTGSYDAQDGTKRYTTDVFADNIEFLARANSNNNSSFNQDAPSVGDQDVQTNETQINNDDPFKNFGNEIVLTDDDLPF